MRRRCHVSSTRHVYKGPLSLESVAGSAKRVAFSYLNLLKNAVALLSSKPVGNRIQVEDGEIIVRPSVVEMNCSTERWLQTDLYFQIFG